MATDADISTPPYPGPRPFRSDEAADFFGRRRETRHLAALAKGYRVVVLHGRSGVGKTSLLQAALIPLLEARKGMRVLAADASFWPEERPEPAIEAAANPYIFGLLLHVFPNTVPAANLLPMRLTEGIGHRLEGSAHRGPCLLVLDAFEGLFAAGARLYDERQDFFRQLHETLEQHPRLSVLLSLGAESLDDLELYTAQLPDRLRTRFRLDMLQPEAALEAIEGPVRRRGLEFAPETARRLVDELCRAPANDPRTAGSTTAAVEPIHLQAVCRQLWRQATTTNSTLEPAAFSGTSSADSALAEDYAVVVGQVAKRHGVPERKIRDWMEHQAVDDDGIGRRVFGDDPGLPPEVLTSLVETNLLHQESRRGRSWVELAHPRLARPIGRHNALWRILALSLLQRRTELWEQENQPDDLLLEGRYLRQARRWAASHREELLPSEHAFLALCRRRMLRRRVQILILALALIAGSAAAGWQTRQWTQDRKRPSVTSVPTQLIDLDLPTTAPEVESPEQLPQPPPVFAPPPPVSPPTEEEVENSSETPANEPPSISSESPTEPPNPPPLPTIGELVELHHTLMDSVDEPTEVAFCGDQVLALGGHLFDGSTGEALVSLKTRGRFRLNLGLGVGLGGGGGRGEDEGGGGGGPVMPACCAMEGDVCVEYCPEEASASAPQNHRSSWGRLGGQFGFDLGRRSEFPQVAWSNDCRFVAAIDRKGGVHVWQAGVGEPVGQLPKKKRRFTEVDFLANNLLITSDDGQRTLEIWQPTGTKVHGLALDASQAGGFASAQPLSDGTVAVLNNAGTVLRFYNLDGTSSRPPKSIAGHRNVALSSDGRWLAAGGSSRTVRLMDFTADPPTWRTHPGHGSTIHQLTFAADGKFLATVDEDPRILLWHVPSGTLVGSIDAPGAPGETLHLAATSRGSPQFAASGSKGLVVWNLKVETWQQRVCDLAASALTAEQWNAFPPFELPFQHFCTQPSAPVETAP